jgi:kinesin family protein 6/9
VFAPAVQDMIFYALCGYKCTIFAYGQTGSGKTFTISGGYNKNSGLIQQTFRYMRMKMLEDTQHDYKIKCTMI